MYQAIVFLPLLGAILAGLIALFGARARFPGEAPPLGDDGTATVRAMMPSALELFADGVLPRIHGDPVEVVIGGRKLGLMVLAEVRCGSEHFGDDIAVLVFRPASVEVRRLPGT